MTFSVGPHVSLGLFYNHLTGFAYSSSQQACPASRLSIAEIKTILAYVVSSFTFEKHTKILPHNMVVNRPYVDGEWEKGQFSLMHLLPG